MNKVSFILVNSFFLTILSACHSVFPENKSAVAGSVQNSQEIQCIESSKKALAQMSSRTTKSYKIIGE